MEHTSNIQNKESGFVQIFKSDGVHDCIRKIYYGFKVGQSCTITGSVVKDNLDYRAPTQDDILADKELIPKGHLVIEGIKIKQRKKSGDTRIFDYKIEQSEGRYSIWRKK